MKKFFSESCLVRYKGLFRAKKVFGVMGTLRPGSTCKVHFFLGRFVNGSMLTCLFTGLFLYIC